MRRAKTLFICDGNACLTCDRQEGERCHISDMRHSRNFKELEKYFDMEIFDNQIYFFEKSELEKK